MRTDVPLDVAEVFKPRVPKAAETFMEDEPMDEELPSSEDVRGILKDAKTVEDTPSTEALVPSVEHTPDEWERGLEPRCMADAVRLAQRMHDSHMFSGYGNGPAVLSTILLGRELGIPAMAALRSVHLIEGKHSLSADLMVALVLRSGMAEYFQMSESTAELCTYVTKRKGNPLPTSLSYTIEQAKQAGLLAPTRSGKTSNWQKIPKQMLRARAKSELARLRIP